MAIMFYPLLAAYAELFDILNLDGNERVLDVGCGLGEMAIGIGRYLKDGNRIDIWNKIEIFVDRASWKSERLLFYPLWILAIAGKRQVVGLPLYRQAFRSIVELLGRGHPTTETPLLRGRAPSLEIGVGKWKK